MFPVQGISGAEGLVIEDRATRLDWAVLVHLLRTLSFSHLKGRGQLVRLFGWVELPPYWLAAGVLPMRWYGGHMGAGLSGSGSSAGCAGAGGVRGTYCGGSCGSSTGSPWNIDFLLLLLLFFFFLSGWVTNTLLCPCLFLQNLAHEGRVCAIRSQESVYGNWSGCPGVPVMNWCTAWAVGRSSMPSGVYPMSTDGQSSSHKLQSFLGVILTP